MFAPRRRTCSRREAPMREWRVRRALQPQPDGQRCWDRAYQQLLAWTQVQNVGATATVVLDPPPQEVENESRPVRPCVHATSGAGRRRVPAAATPARARARAGLDGGGGERLPR